MTRLLGAWQKGAGYTTAMMLVVNKRHDTLKTFDYFKISRKQQLIEKILSPRPQTETFPWFWQRVLCQVHCRGGSGTRKHCHDPSEWGRFSQFGNICWSGDMHQLAGKKTGILIFFFQRILFFYRYSRLNIGIIANCNLQLRLDPVFRGSKATTAAPHMSAPGSNPGKDASLIRGHGFKPQNTTYSFRSFDPNARITRPYLEWCIGDTWRTSAVCSRRSNWLTLVPGNLESISPTCTVSGW